MKYVELDRPWKVDKQFTNFMSPSTTDDDAKQGRGRQELIFDEFFRDGTISAEVKVFEGNGQNKASHTKDAALIFRYQNPSNYYFAGLGGVTNKFSIFKVVDGQTLWVNSTGLDRDIEFGRPYDITIGCAGNRIVLLLNNVTVLESFDSSFQSGKWGFRTLSALAQFSKISKKAIEPSCFVAMPFAQEFDAVYHVIKTVVEEAGYHCIRVDERYLVGPIMADVNEQIENAEFVIADLTGKNPNVYFEAGYAAALRKPIIQIAQKAEDLPFDVRHLRIFIYKLEMLGDRKLAENLRQAIQANVRLF